MSDGRKNSLKSSSAWFLCLFLLYITANTSANYPSKHIFGHEYSGYRDTIPNPSASPDSLKKTTDTVPELQDSLAKKSDTVDMNMSKDSLDAPIDYSASDSIVFQIPEKKIYLYSQGSVKKGDAELSSDTIMIDQATNIVTALPTRDSAGRIISKPKMTQADATMSSDYIRYNTKTQRGLTQSTITQQGEIFIQGEKIKKVNINDFYAFRGQFTTCNLDTPHFAFRTRKMKLVNKKLAISGPVHPEFEGVPIPVYLPFGIFPISQGRHSGFLPPQFNASEQFGLGLQGMGYYKVLNDNFDVTLSGDVYSYGGWAAYLAPEYRKRYRYNGRMMLTLQKNRLISEDPKEEYTDTKLFSVNWSHTVDGKARPGTSFSANVNVSSSKFNRLQNNAAVNYNNSMNSSVSYSKTWTGANLTASANHNQNNNTGLYTVSLPTISFTANTIYPFQKKEQVGTPKWYEKFGIGLNTNIANQLNFYDTAFSFSQLLDTLQWGAQHNIPIQLSLPALGPLQIAPGVSYGERWYSRQLALNWKPDPAKPGFGSVDTTVTKGFYSARELAFSVSLSTALFGKFEKFGKNSNIRAIRHVVRPTVSFSYRPDLSSSSYSRVQTGPDSLGEDKFETYSYYDYQGALYGAYSQGTFGGISFGIDNNVEMKARSKKDTADELKKIRLIDGFGITGNYNFLADTMKLTPLSMYLRSTLFEQINITTRATLDPYQTNARGLPIDKYAWQGGKFSLGRITSASVAISTTFKSKADDEKKEKEEQEAQENGQNSLTMEEQMAQMEYIRANPAEFADFNIPWSVNLSYSLNYSTRRKSDYTGFESEINSNINMSGDFNMTPKWKVGVNTFYDLKTSAIQQLTMFISREMHCWQLSINVTPVGIYRSFNITVSPKSGILRDLRINRTRSFYGG